MITQVTTGANAPSGDPARRGTAESGAPVDQLAPVIAGARARGIADAFEMIGEGAILLDFSGSVLHVGQLARPMLGAAVSVAGGHVVAVDRKAAGALQGLLEVGLSDGAPRTLEADLLCVEEGMRQRVRLLQAPGGDAYQLLAAVLVLEPPRRVRCRRMDRRRMRPEQRAAG